MVGNHYAKKHNDVTRIDGSDDIFSLNSQWSDLERLDVNFE